MSSLQNKLYNYEQTPPGKVWENIAAALDESHFDDKFPSKLYNTEAVPPATSWDKIVSSLETEHAPAVAIPQRSFPLFRYAAAAVVIGLVAFGVIKWAGGNNNDKSNKGIVVSKDSTRGNQKTGQPNEKNTAEVTREKENVTTAEENTADVATTEPAKVPRVKKVKTQYSISDNIDDAVPVYAYEHTPNLADRYIMLMTPDGGIVRMSKKLGNLVCCVSGQEQDENCKDQLKKLQEKMACSPAASSPGNFMDILSLVSSLNDTEL